MIRDQIRLTGTIIELGESDHAPYRIKNGANEADTEGRLLRSPALRLLEHSGVLRATLFIVLMSHGLIHLVGFVQAFGLGRIEGLHKPISRLAGLLWLSAAALFLLAALMLLWAHGWWWLAAMAGVFLSQNLVILNWSDARFGTLANALIVIAAAIGMSLCRMQDIAEHQLATAAVAAHCPAQKMAKALQKRSNHDFD